ncbi:hypothetical protein [Nannocystis radixulma]|uniref:Uncharacterized protein n=1 Tax=Nannocystis radixulma TaxID=2995305 RepID=A0ABT5AXU8_9BACT|nr:hypothetical protein [Nannocystis radixulma]MDC0666679.1 hypothetical protein [Nannocystis radixulma]
MDPGNRRRAAPQHCNDPFCGNGAKEEGVPCNDGNKVETDACTNICMIAT